MNDASPLSVALNIASQEWDGWNILYEWEEKSGVSFSVWKVMILSHAYNRCKNLSEKNFEGNSVKNLRVMLKEAINIIYQSKFLPVYGAIKPKKVKTNSYLKTAPNYDYLRARRLYYKYKKITGGTRVICGNPDCNKNQLAKLMDLHHLLPRRVSPSWTYEASNMILICKKCHRHIHEGWEAYWNLKKRMDKST